MCRGRRADRTARRGGHAGRANAYFSVAIPLFVLACMLHLPFVGVLAMVTFWLLPTVLRVAHRPEPVMQQEPQSIPSAPVAASSQPQESADSLYAGTEYPRD